MSFPKTNQGIQTSNVPWFQGHVVAYCEDVGRAVWRPSDLAHRSAMASQDMLGHISYFGHCSQIPYFDTIINRSGGDQAGVPFVPVDRQYFILMAILQTKRRTFDRGSIVPQVDRSIEACRQEHWCIFRRPTSLIDGSLWQMFGIDCKLARQLRTNIQLNSIRRSNEEKIHIGWCHHRMWKEVSSYLPCSKILSSLLGNALLLAI